jgi:uncharacterized membrane protein (DUF441 family)
MIRLLRRTVTSVALGVVLAGFVSAVLLATIPATWRGPHVVASAIIATVAAVVFVRGLRPPEP